MQKEFLFFVLFFLTITQISWALDYGFRYDAKSEKCLNSVGKEGINVGLQIIECADFSRIGIGGIPLEGARLLGLNISKILDDVSDIQDMLDINSADARGLKAVNTGFINGNFSNANLEKADFSESSFSSRGRRETTFENANLRNAKFRNASFLGINLKGADLRGADLTGLSFLECAWQGSTYDQYTKLPFSEATAERLGMHYSDSGGATPVDYDNLLAPPKFPAIKDDRIFEKPEFCNTKEECDKKFTQDLTERLVLSGFGETVWRLTAKNSEGSIWMANQIALWRPSNLTYLSIADAKSYCKNKNLKLPSSNQFSVLSDNGFSSLFPETSKNKYWTSTQRGSSIPDLYYFFDAVSGAFFVDIATKKGAIVCAD